LKTKLTALVTIVLASTACGATPSVASNSDESFVESGTDPHMVSNDSDTATATVYATFIAPVGSPFRFEATPPACA
jgi:hypothetical protein